MIAPGSIFVEPGSAARTAPLLGAQRACRSKIAALPHIRRFPVHSPNTNAIHRRASLQRQNILSVKLASVDENTGVATGSGGFERASKPGPGKIRSPVGPPSNPHAPETVSYQYRPGRTSTSYCCSRNLIWLDLRGVPLTTTSPAG